MPDDVLPLLSNQQQVVLGVIVAISEEELLPESQQRSTKNEQSGGFVQQRVRDEFEELSPQSYFRILRQLDDRGLIHRAHQNHAPLEDAAIVGGPRFAANVYLTTEGERAGREILRRQKDRRDSLSFDTLPDK